ncbi:MAG TPA: FAD/NAD(P)-binding oxidoreductase [Burkholderiaceae bacterium]|nr:FAD/NAD(P)-binding oxidoreductase [Burkholderiaceae bacterium]HMX09531.1 FAD/NAD(P)-binding oxidoreductase [Burkholderiaceae bacterium]HMY98841.1 FAD/NAD(P)-binding oxidoreductase [Burkholderiaceae bacterium]HNB42952.1 FAD/NAD(P)-binding oxidoreductase [Burkholderiaceae bacterium]HNG79055.1 FAD/NAD(P)-binding oxidoreductase [Burkholderiaceae bacterium]
MTLQRRTVLSYFGAAAAANLAGCATPTAPAISAGSAADLMPMGASRRVVVVGAGYGGTIAAKYIRMQDPGIEVVLIERNDHHVSCPFSNLYIGGILKDLSSLTIRYDELVARHGIRFVQAEVLSIDAAAHVVLTSRGRIGYSRLILSPGIDFRPEDLAGYDDAAMAAMPHAWKAGPQTQLLRRQLEAMRDGATVVMTVPLTPYRCPPGPYERANMIAHYLKQHKPKSKLIVLDANPDVTSKGALFKKGWKDNYAALLEYQPAKKVTEVDVKGMSVLVEGVEAVKGDVINVIPPQRAGRVAVAAGLVGEDRNWCPVNALSFESTKVRDIHVIGDACNAGAMPKSGYSANSEAKICATNVVALLNGRETVEMSGINTCYSFINDREAVSVAGVYKAQDGKIVAVPNSGGVSPIDFSVAKAEAIYAQSWLRNILTEMSS